MKADKLINHLQAIQDGWDQHKAQALLDSVHAIREPNAMAHPSAGLLAEKLESLILPYINKNESPTPDKLPAILNTLTKLHEVMTVNVNSQEIFSLEAQLLKHHTLIVGLQDIQLAEEIAQQVKYFSYTCVFCQSLEEVLQVANGKDQEKFGAIILDTAFCTLTQTQELQSISQKIPLIFISEEEDVATRLFAVKAGGKAFFLTPIEFTTLLETIDQVVTPPSETLPFRILIVEDSKTQASIIRNHLEQAGMITQILVDPLKIMDELTDFQPDLILLDLYMPQCSGVDLAKVIRQ
ncbi:MAG: response regulator, partial [Candidatus Berkiella sp.]